MRIVLPLRGKKLVVFVPLSHREIGKQKNTIENFYNPLATEFGHVKRDRKVGGFFTSLRGRKKLAVLLPL